MQGKSTSSPENTTNSLPPGFRFHPTDEELIVYYLKNQAKSKPCPVSIIPEVDIYKFDPWQLPEKADFGENEWYFFTPRDRKYPNGVRPNRATVSGYWKATGTDKAIYSGAINVGIKKALVFYKGRPPKGTKTDWIMHEYRLNDPSRPLLHQIKQPHGSMRLDDWVLCRIYRKRHAGRTTEPRQEEQAAVLLEAASQGIHNQQTPMNINATTKINSEAISGGCSGEDQQSSKFPRTFSLAHLCEWDMSPLLNHANYNSTAAPSFEFQNSGIIGASDHLDSIGCSSHYLFSDLVKINSSNQTGGLSTNQQQSQYSSPVYKFP